MGGEAEGVEEAENEEDCAPPNGGVKVIKDDGVLGRMGEFVEPGAKN